MQITIAQENQTAVNETAQIEGMIDELLLGQPVLSELTDEEDAGVIEYLNELDTQEAVHTLLGLNALQALIELHLRALEMRLQLWQMKQQPIKQDFK